MPSLGFEALGAVVMLLVYSIMIAGVMKIFQLAGEVAEIKKTLNEVRRTLATSAPVAPNSPESLVRAVNSASYADIIEDAIRSEPQR